MSMEAFAATSLTSKRHRLNNSWIIYTCYVEDLFFRKVLNQRSLLQLFTEAFKKFGADFDSEYRTGRLSRFVVEIIQSLMIRINVSSKVVQIEKVTHKSDKEAVTADEPASTSQTQIQAASRHRKFAACHQFFTDNVAYPYPSDKAERENLATQDGVDLKQVDQWFTNHRKRSGWNDICNIAENKETASKLVNLVVSGTNDSMLPSSVTSIVTAYIQRATNSTESIPSDWLRNAISQLSIRYPFLTKKRKRDEKSSDYLHTFFQNHKKIRLVNIEFTLV